MRRFVFAGCLAGLLVAAGVAGLSWSGRSHGQSSTGRLAVPLPVAAAAAETQRVSPSRNTGNLGGPARRPLVVAPTPAQRALLRRVSAAVPSSLTRLEISAGPTGSGSWLYVTHPIESSSAVHIADVWHGEAIAAAFQSRCRAASVPCLTGFGVTGPHGDQDGDFSFAIARSERPTALAPVVSSTIARNAARAGLSGVLVTLDTFHGQVFAMVTATAVKPRSFLKDDGPTAVFAKLALPATLLEIRDRSGAAIYADGLGQSIRTGETWVASKYDNDTAHFSPPQIVALPTSR
jgi:hypothetical protein